MVYDHFLGGEGVLSHLDLAMQKYRKSLKMVVKVHSNLLCKAVSRRMGEECDKGKMSKTTLLNRIVTSRVEQPNSFLPQGSLRPNGPLDPSVDFTLHCLRPLRPRDSRLLLARLNAEISSLTQGFQQPIACLIKTSIKPIGGRRRHFILF